MEMLIQQLVNGLFLGSIYALLALGYTMVYGIIKLINFAHGEVYMLGAFLGYYFIRNISFLQNQNVSFFVALVLSMLCAAIIGMAIEFIAYRPLRTGKNLISIGTVTGILMVYVLMLILGLNTLLSVLGGIAIGVAVSFLVKWTGYQPKDKSTRISALITAIGVSFLIQNMMIQWVKSDPRAFPQAITPKTYHLGIIEVSNIQLIILFVSVLLMILLQLIVQKSKMGKAMRAVSVDPDAAQLMGINVNFTISFTFALGSALAAAAGILIGLYYNSIDPMMGVVPGLKAFVAAVVGGIGIIPGAALGGFVIGLLETATIALGFSDYKDAVVYALLIIILLIRPAGILGKNIKEKV